MKIHGLWWIGRIPDYAHRVGRSWELLGQRNPLGAILTDNTGAIRQWDLDEFFATGRVDAERFDTDLKQIQPAVSRVKALDFGCGVGRVTRALAEYFDQVVGVDIASSMIAEARRLNADVARTSFVVNRAPHLRQFQSRSFNVIYCRLVLQHLHPRFVHRYIPELIRLLAPGGVLMFQIPAEPDYVDGEEAFCSAPVSGGLKRLAPRRLVRWYRRLKYRLIVDYPYMEMETHDPRMHLFAISKERVLRLVEESGGVLLSVRPDQSHGVRGQGFEYWVTRPL
jgi:SAM-dependent methyltransferase